MKLPDVVEDDDFDFSIYGDENELKERTFVLGKAPKLTYLKSRFSDGINTLNILGDMKGELAKKYYDMLKNPSDINAYKELYAILTAIYMKIRYIQGVHIMAKVEKVQKHCLKLINKYSGSDTIPTQLMKYHDVYTSFVYDMLWHNNLMIDTDRIGGGTKAKEQIIQ